MVGEWSLFLLMMDAKFVNFEPEVKLEVEEENDINVDEIGVKEEPEEDHIVIKNDLSHYSKPEFSSKFVLAKRDFNKEMPINL